MSCSVDWFAQAATELDQIAAQLVKSMARKAVAALSHNDEAQLVNLAQSLNAIAANARNSVVWRCGVAAVCGENPASLDTNSSGSSTVGGPAAAFQMTNLDSRVSVISRLTDLLSLIYVAHDYFAGSDHEAVLKSNTVSMLAVVAAACDVPFLPQPLCASALDALAACLTEVTAVVHAEQSVLSDGSNSNACEPPRRFPLTFSLPAQRYMLRSLSRRVFAPTYASWLISALGAPDRLTPYPGSSAALQVSNGGNSSHADWQGGDGLNNDGSGGSGGVAGAQLNCFLKDAIVRICCGAFMGDGPRASPHSYVATSIHVLSMMLLAPLEMVGGGADGPQQQQQQQQQQGLMRECFDRRAPRIFGGSSVEGIATILEQLTRRVAAPFEHIAAAASSSSSNGGAAASRPAPPPEKVIRQTRRLLKFFWSVRPLVESLSACSLTRKAFISAQGTRSLFDFVWKTVAGLLDAVAAEREAARGAATFHTSADGSNSITALAASSASPFLAGAHCSPVLSAAILSACTVLLPIGCSIWRAVAAVQGGGENREFVETVALFAAKAAPLLVPPPAARFVVDASTGSDGGVAGGNFSSPFFSSYDSLLAFDALVDAVEYAAAIEGGGGGAAAHSSLREFLAHASPEGTHIAVRSAPDSAEEQAAIIQSQWAALLLTLGVEDSVARCRLASIVEPPRSVYGSSSSSNNNNVAGVGGGVSILVGSDGSATAMGSNGGAPPHLVAYAAASASTANTTTTVVVDTALRDAARSNDDVGAYLSSATPDTVLACLCAASGSPLAEDLPRWMPSSVLRRGLLRLACRAASATAPASGNKNVAGSATNIMSARDICRVFIRPPNFAAAVVNRLNHSHQQTVQQQQQHSANGISLSWPPVISVIGPPARAGFDDEASVKTSAASHRELSRQRSDFTVAAGAHGLGGAGGGTMASHFGAGSKPFGIGAPAAAPAYLNNMSLNSIHHSGSGGGHHHFFNTSSAAGIGIGIGSGGEAEATANALRIELAEQRAVNFELQRELQKRSGEAGAMDARLRALNEQLAAAEMDVQQHRVAAETTRQLLEQERQHKAQLFHAETQMRQELGQAVGRLRELERSHFEAVQQAEARTKQLSAQLAAVHAELEMTKRSLSQSEERVQKFLGMQASMRDMMRNF